MTQAREQGTSPLGKAVWLAGTYTTVCAYTLHGMSLMSLDWNDHRII